MRRLLFASLRTRLVLLVLLPVVPMAGLSFFGFAQQRAQVVHLGREQAKHYAAMAAGPVGETFTGTRELLMLLARNLSQAPDAAEECREQVGNLMSPFFVSLAVVTPQGEIICGAGARREAASYSAVPEVLRAFLERRFVVGGYRSDPLSGRPAVHAAYPVVDRRGQVAAVAVVALDPAWLSQVTARTQLPPPATTLFIADAEGTILAGNIPGAWLGGRLPQGTLERSLSGFQQGAVEAADPTGARTVFGVAAVRDLTQGGPLYVGVGIPTAVVLGEVRRTFLQGLAVLAAIATVAVLAAWATGSVLILRPVRAVAAAAERVRGGDLAVRTGVRGAGELGRLGETFDQMAVSLGEHLAERRRAEEALTRTNRDLALILGAAGEGIFGLDLRGRATSVNPAAAAMLGWPAEELIGHPIHGLIHHTHGDGRRYDPETCPIYAAFTDGTVHRGEDEVFWRKDGTSFPVAYTSTPIREGGQISGAVVVFNDITDRRRAQKARLAQEAAEQANRAKSEFISRMSHEIRTPLNAVLGFAQLLEMDALTPEQQESVRHILKAGRHLLDLITEVLDIARIEAGRLPVSPEPVPVAEIVAESVAMVRPLAEAEGLRLEDRLAQGPRRFVAADRQRLKQVLLNLLSNAVKYNRPRGLIEVWADEREGGALRISVRDTGPGIDPERAAQLFTPFERLGADRTEIEGSGLGLALSKRMVEAMGGRLGLESRDGEGSVFWVELPQTAPDDIGAPWEAPPSPQPAVRTVLCIDDNLSSVGVLRGLLARRPGVSLLPAMQGRIGLDLARQHRPDLILLDLHLPDVPGRQVLARLRADPETRHIPVVVISADPSGGEAERMRAAGASAYLAKPVDVQQLLTILDEALAVPAPAGGAAAP